VADLTNPILQEWTKEPMKKANDWVLAGKVPFIARERCWPIGVPGFVIWNRGQPLRFIQTKNQVWMINELYGITRRVYLNVGHSANPKPSWWGESIGHYEGDTLVVDTIGLSPRAFIDDFQTPHSDKLHVVERYRLTDGGKQLEVRIHVEDEGAFTTPWNAIQRFRRAEPGEHEYVPVVEIDATSGVGVTGPLQESACTEATSHFEHNAGIPQSAAPDF
jgi:hypothetical protein